MIKQYLFLTQKDKKINKCIALKTEHLMIIKTKFYKKGYTNNKKNLNFKVNKSKDLEVFLNFLANSHLFIVCLLLPFLKIVSKVLLIMSEYYSSSIINDILDRIDIVDLISEHIVLKKRGINFVGLCPFHHEKTPSFTVNQEKQIFRCFGCGVGGNIFEFHKKFHNLSFRDSLKELAKKANIALAFDEDSQELEKTYEIKQRVYDIYKIASNFYKWNLEHSEHGEEARAYLKNRNIPNEMLEKFIIGFAPNNWDTLYRYLKNKHFTEDEIKKSGLVVIRSDEKYYDFFRNRIMFPIQNEQSEVIAFGGRTLDSASKAKYINSPETAIYTKGKTLYALNHAKAKIRELDKVILVEGYLDVIACHKYGFENTVASLGTALTTEQAKKIIRYTSSKKVIVCYDADFAGQQATERGTEVLEEVSKGMGIDINVIKISNGKDPDEFLEREGKEAFQNLIDIARPIIEFKIEKILSEEDLINPLGKSKAIDRCIKVLSKIQDNIYRDEMIKNISNFSVDGQRFVREEEIRRKLKMFEFATNKVPQPFKPKSQNYYNYRKNKEDYLDAEKAIKYASEYQKVSSVSQAEQGLIYFMVERGKALNYIKEKLEYMYFQDELNEKIRQIIFNFEQDEENIITWKGLLQLLTESEEQQRIVEIWESFENLDISSDKILKDFIRQVKHNFLRQQRDDLREWIDSATKDGQIDISISLVEKYLEIQKELKELESNMSQARLS